MPSQKPQREPLQKRLSVSTWSLHNHLGAPKICGPEYPQTTFDSQKLLQLPAQIAAFGISTLEICHFHLPSRDAAFLAEMKSELQLNGIELWTLLIDGGDLNHAQNAARDAKWMASWFSVASQLGAKNARVIAGKGAPTPENQAQSVAALQDLAPQSEALGLRLLTENWFDMTGTPAATLQLLEALDGKLGLMMDFGNWKGQGKYEDLAQIAPYAESCHTKAAFQNGQIEREDFVQCLEITKAANFQGPYTLIYDSGGDEWQGLSAEREIVLPYLA
ncbi:Sugar phosphate isomerase/epimerase [Abditibacterium utsteinense]|uniref:Sugar phosphate isomerase/epimerase n=1 Tax=Abditibacterium utsteinense TaxID=1960156 RepID=A0A2S8STF5_9BACT|nr:TIM barrel protein [Abditibacterium utsteinense]PQV64077.1 Sugar phosphate isomerase/epimerase [Abditibacterium utsteinense]